MLCVRMCVYSTHTQARVITITVSRIVQIIKILTKYCFSSTFYVAHILGVRPCLSSSYWPYLIWYKRILMVNKFSFFLKWNWKLSNATLHIIFPRGAPPKDQTFPFQVACCRIGTLGKICWGMRTSATYNALLSFDGVKTDSPPNDSDPNIAFKVAKERPDVTSTLGFAECDFTWVRCGIVDIDQQITNERMQWRRKQERDESENRRSKQQTET